MVACFTYPEEVWWVFPWPQIAFFDGLAETVLTVLPKQVWACPSFSERQSTYSKIYLSQEASMAAVIALCFHLTHLRYKTCQVSRRKGAIIQGLHERIFSLFFLEPFKVRRQTSEMKDQLRVLKMPYHRRTGKGFPPPRPGLAARSRM